MGSITGAKKKKRRQAARLGFQVIDYEFGDATPFTDLALTNAVNLVENSTWPTDKII